MIPEYPWILSFLSHIIPGSGECDVTKTGYFLEGKLSITVMTNTSHHIASNKMENHIAKNYFFSFFFSFFVLSFSGFSFLDFLPEAAAVSEDC